MNVLRAIEREDINDLFEWRNHPLSRKNSFRPDPIPWEEHEKWFGERLADSRTTIYVLTSNQDKLGSVRFEESEEVIRISAMLNPCHMGKNVGSDLIERGTRKFIQENKPRKPIIAEIKADNRASHKAFSKAGFKEHYVVYIYDGKDESDE